MCVCECVCVYLLTPPHKQDVTPDQFFMRNLIGLNLEFSFFSHSKAKEPSLPNYFPHIWRKNCWNPTFPQGY